MVMADNIILTFR